MLVPILSQSSLSSEFINIDVTYIHEQGHRYQLTARPKNIGITKKGIVSYNQNLNGVDLLLRFGKAKESSHDDCYSLILSYSYNKEDKLSAKRHKYFERNFQFDSNHSQHIEECLYLSNPFSKRLLFYYLVQLLDEIDLDKSEAKLERLEEDKYLIDFIILNFESYEKALKSTIHDDNKLQNQSSTSRISKVVSQYIKNQLDLLTKLRRIYSYQYSRLVHDESL